VNIAALVTWLRLYFVVQTHFANMDNAMFNDQSGQYIGSHVFGHNSPAAAAREMFKPSTDSARFLVPSQKKCSVLSLGFSWGDVTSGSVLAFLWPTLRGPGRPWNGPTFWPKYFLEIRLSYEFLEPLIGFLAYLDQKLYHKNQKVVKISTPKKETRAWITPRLHMAIFRR